MRAAATMTRAAATGGRPSSAARRRRRPRWRAGDARRALPRRAARVERGIGGAGGAAAAGGPAPAGGAGAPGQPRAKLIVFVTAGRALHIPREVEAAADAIFWTAHLGTFAGDAIADILAGVASPTARLSHGLPIADGITSGFDTRQARIDRPAVPVVPGSASRRQRASLVRLLSRPRRPLARGLLFRRRLFLHELRALRLVARATARSRSRPARRSPPASG